MNDALATPQEDESDRWPIPESWVWSSMGAISEVIGGGTPATNDPENFGGEIAWVTPADLSGYQAKRIGRGARSITQKGLSTSGARLIPTHTVLFSSRAPIGYVAIAANPLSTNQGFKSFVLREPLQPDYVYYYLQRARELAVARASGTTFLEISGAKARTIPIPIAPLSEQARIVAGIERQFARLDVGLAALHRVQAQLGRYRASVLKAACEGRLVPTEAALARREKRDYEPADQLLVRILKERRVRWEANYLERAKSAHKPPKDDRWKADYVEPASPNIAELGPLPEGWCHATVEQLVDARKGMITGPFGTLISKADHRARGVAVLGIPNIDSGRFVEGAAFHLSPEKAASLTHYIVEPGDLVVSRSGTVGETCVVPSSATGSLISTNLMRLRVLDHVDPAWCVVNFRGSPVIARQMKALCKGSTRPFLNLGILSQLVVVLPPFREQQRALARVEELLSIETAANTLTRSASLRADRLRESILSTAFEGRLVAQDPADQRASELIELVVGAVSNPPGSKGTAPKRGGDARRRRMTR